MTRTAAFECACTNVAATVRAGADLFELPRFLVRDWDRETFAARLTSWVSD